MDNNIKKKKKISIIVLIIIILLMILIIGIAYAFFGAEKTLTHNITSRLINIEYVDGNIINAEKIIPLKDDEINDEATTITFNVESKDVDIVYYDIEIDDIDAPLGLRNTCFKWRLYETTSGEDVLLNEGDFLGVDKEKIMVKDQIIEAQATKNYKLQIWLSETGEDQSELMGLEFSGKINIEARDRLLNKYDGEIVVINDSNNGIVPDLKIYGKTDEEGNSVGDDGTINLQVTQNLIKNGLGEYGDCTNFRYCSYSEEKYKSLGSFIESERYSLRTTIYDIGLDKEYINTRLLKDLNDNNTTKSGGFEFYDIDGIEVGNASVITDENYLTRLTQDLNNGDKKIYVEDANVFKYNPLIKLWNYRDSTGHLYPDLSYTHNAWQGIYTTDNVNIEENTITLNEPWNNGFFKKGALVASNFPIGHASITGTLEDVGNGWKEYRLILSTKKDPESNNDIVNELNLSIKSALFMDGSNVNSQTPSLSRIIFAETKNYEVPIEITISKPLRSNGEVADYIDFNTGKIVRKIGEDGNILDKEVVEEIDLPEIPTYDGNTIIETTDEVMPILEVKY